MAIRRRFPILENLGNTLRETWHLGFTAFGGPPVHFKIVRLFAIALTLRLGVGLLTDVVVLRQVYYPLALG